jgi:hypothetical protein
MDERDPDDRLPVIELLVYVPSSFLMAWFLAGFSLWQLLELIPQVAFTGRWLVGTIAGAWLIRQIVRQLNRQHDPRHRIGRRGGP